MLSLVNNRSRLLPLADVALRASEPVVITLITLLFVDISSEIVRRISYVRIRVFSKNIRL
jgi:hypothetical protein